MFPALLDMTENESLKCLRIMELDAYSSLITALRAQGPPNSDKLRLIKDVGVALHISNDRYKAEVRRVILDEKLNTIAYYAAGHMETGEEWIKEGRRVVPLVPRTNPHTVYSAIADEVADATILNNEQLPLPAHTERKRSSSFSHAQQPQTDKSQFRSPETVKHEDKKRKLPFTVESSTLAQHLIGSQKMSRIQQLYRQRAKTKRDQQMQVKVKKEREFQRQKFLHFPSRNQKLPLSLQSPSNVAPKINIIQNIALPLPKKGEGNVEIKNETNLPNPIVTTNSIQTISPKPGCSNENQAPRTNQPMVTIKSASNISYKHVSSPGPSSDSIKSKIAAKKPLTKTTTGQKLIIVSNAQSIASTSILQRTLTIPFVKNVSMKSFDKFKIVQTGVCTSGLQLTPVTASGTVTTPKHKMVTVRANPAAKKVIPLAHLQALTAKGSIKMMPVGGKIITKPSAPITTNTTPLYLMNNIGSLQALTKSTPSTPIMVTCKAQEPKVDVTHAQTENAKVEGEKSSVLAGILKASGVSEMEADVEMCATGIPKVPEVANCDVQSILYDLEVKEDAIEKERAEKDRSTEQLLKDLEGEDSCDAIGSLDPGTGEYVIETSTNQGMQYDVCADVSQPTDW